MHRLQPDTVAEMLSSHFKSLTVDQKNLFLSKLIGDNGESLDALLQYIKSPLAYKYPEIEGLSIGDTAYFNHDHVYGSNKVDLRKNGDLIDGKLHPATILDIQFFPCLALIVRFHEEAKGKRPSVMNSHYLVKLDLI